MVVLTQKRVCAQYGWFVVEGHIYLYWRYCDYRINDDSLLLPALRTYYNFVNAHSLKVSALIGSIKAESLSLVIFNSKCIAPLTSWEEGGVSPLQ